jgi:hypothetical protein
MLTSSVKYAVLMVVVALISCHSVVLNGSATGSGPQQLSVEDQLMLLDWACEEDMFSLEIVKEGWEREYVIHAKFSNEVLVLGDYSESQAIGAYVDLTVQWEHMGTMERCEVMVNWQRM